MPSIFGPSPYSTLRARDGANYGLLDLLANLPVQSSFGFFQQIATWGPGATADVPGTRFYLLDSGGGVFVTEGTVVGHVPGVNVANSAVEVYYDQAADRLYYLMSNLGALALEYFDGAAWVALPAPVAVDQGFGCIQQLPTTAVSGPGQIIVGGGNEVRRWDGAAWLLDLTNPVDVFPLALAPYGAEMVLCNLAGDNTPDPTDVLIQLRSTAGAWSDITPVAWNSASVPQERWATCACAYNGELYACFITDSLSKREIWKRDVAGVWALELDLVVELPPDGYVHSMSVIDGVLHCGMDLDYQGGDYLTKDGSGWHHNALPADLQAPATASSVQFFVEAPEGTIDPPAGNCSGEYGAQIRVAGFWDAQPFEAWGIGTAWEQTVGLWSVITSPSVGTQVFIGNGVQQYVGHGNIGGDWRCGEIDVVDPFVLTCMPPNGAGFANVQVDNTLAPGHGLITEEDFPLWLPNGYEFLCPTITSVDPASGSLLGGYTVTLHGANFYSNLINPSNPLNRTRVVNRIWVRTSAGRVEEVDSRLITFVDTETLEFPMAPYPGGTDPVVELLFRPAGLAPFFTGIPYGITPLYQCARVATVFEYTGVVFAILGSLETLLGLGGPGSDVAFPSGGAAVGSVIVCPTEPDAGPCVR